MPRRSTALEHFGLRPWFGLALERLLGQHNRTDSRHTSDRTDKVEA